MKYSFKLSLIGDEFTGKTSIILRYIKNTFLSEYKATLGADFVDKIYNSKNMPELEKNTTISATIWDMAGQAHFKDIASIYLEGSMAILIVFDVNNPKSFENLPKWKKLRDDICPISDIVIIGNKCDLENLIPDSEIEEMEKTLGTKIIFGSAKTNENVLDIFADVVRKIYQKL
jgi:small GTP-binding protein